MAARYGPITGLLAGAKVRGLAADFIRNFSALYGELQASKCWQVSWQVSW